MLQVVIHYLDIVSVTGLSEGHLKKQYLVPLLYLKELEQSDLQV